MFQKKKIIQIFGDIPGVEVYFDDIAIAGNDYNDHDKIFNKVIERAIKNNTRFNVNKIQYRYSEIEFMGHIISDGLIRPNNKYLRAIKEIKTPTNKTEVLRLLGLFKYLAKFIPNLSQRTANIQALTHKNKEWESSTHENEFKKIYSNR